MYDLMSLSKIKEKMIELGIPVTLPQGTKAKANDETKSVRNFPLIFTI
jgi:hypothetical protein